MKPPHLQTLGYALDGGRLLPGDKGPVTQFMYHDNSGASVGGCGTGPEESGDSFSFRHGRQSERFLLG